LSAEAVTGSRWVQDPGDTVGIPAAETAAVEVGEAPEVEGVPEASGAGEVVAAPGEGVGEEQGQPDHPGRP